MIRSWFILIFQLLYVATTTRAFVEQLPTLQNPAVTRRSSSTRCTNFVVLRASPPPLPNFCADCGSDAMELRIPDGDERLRACCTVCGRIEYSNPKVVVSCVVRDGSNILLAKRAIEPRKGTWGIPQGFLEHGETSREAAIREIQEETGAVCGLEDLQFRAVYNVPGSVQLVYQANVQQADLNLATATHESTDIGWFSTDQLPELCFPTVQWAIDHCVSGPSGHIQQRTKFYNVDSGEWGEFEDEPYIS